MSEIDELRRRAEWAEGQLRARDRADAEARITAMAKQQKQQDDSANAERQAALQAEIERTRRGAWVVELLKNADPTAPFDANKFEEAIPQTGWPADDGPHNYHFAGQPVFGSDNDDVAGTMLGKILNEIQENAARLKRAT
jgi:hypothetical protein